MNVVMHSSSATLLPLMASVESFKSWFACPPVIDLLADINARSVVF